MPKINRKLMAPVAALLIAFIFAMACPLSAFALGWDPTSMAQQAAGQSGTTITTIDQNTVATWVTNITTFLLGIAIVIFVLKVVLTAICEMLMADNDGMKDTLQGIPLIGAYKIGNGDCKNFKDVFLKKFAKNLAIVVGAWVLVQLVVGLVLWLFGTFTQTS